MRVKSILPLAATSVMVLAATGAHASTLAFTTQSAFTTAATGGAAPANQVADAVNWGMFDSAYSQPNNNGSIQYGSTVTTALGEGVTVTNSSAPSNLAFTTYTEGGPNWQGNFVAGTTILYNGSNETTTLTFANALSGLGVDLQVESGSTGLPKSYTFTLTAYDALGTVLGTATDSGVSHGISTGSTYEGTVSFAGITSSSANIKSVTISSSQNSAGFAIDTSIIYHNNLQTGGSGGSQQTPEPGTLGLLGAGLAGLGAIRRKRKQKNL